jgi:hypothetical protein
MARRRWGAAVAVTWLAQCAISDLGQRGPVMIVSDVSFDHTDDSSAAPTSLLLCCRSYWELTGGVGATGLANKGVGPRVSSHAKMRICWIPVSMDMEGVSCSGRIRRRTLLGASCLEIDGSDGIRSGAPVFLSDRLVPKGSLWSSAGCYHYVRRFIVPWWSQSSGKCHGCRVLGTSNGD